MRDSNGLAAIDVLVGANSNAGLFVFVGAMVVVQGGRIGRWSCRFGDRWLILMGLCLFGIGLLLTALTPPRPVLWYSETALAQELSGGRNLPDKTPAVQNI